MKPKLSPSLMCLDLLNAGAGVRALEEAGADYLHIDIMDNHFVPNITLSPDFVRAVKAAARVPLDVHLMIERPERSIDAYSCLGGEDILCVHCESTPHIQRALDRVKALDARAGVALNPGTPVSALEDLLPGLDMVLVMTVNPGFAGQAFIPAALEKIARARRLLDERGFQSIPIEVDGNVSFEAAPVMRAMGADIFVCGTSSVFSKEGTLRENCARLRGAIGP